MERMTLPLTAMSDNERRELWEVQSQQSADRFLSAITFRDQQSTNGNAQSFRELIPELAKCYDSDPGLFISSGYERKEDRLEREARAKAICVGCPLIEQCFEFAVVHNEFGIWGGTTEAERR